MNYLKPERLKHGGLIGIISPASSPDDFSLAEKGINYIESLGYRTLPGKNLGKYRGYLAGTDKERVDDIHQMFSNRKVQAIFCLRGGYGAFRLLDKIDYELIRKNPKIFIGFSEITALQMAFLKKANLISFAGPMVVPNFSDKINSYTEENFWRIITSAKIPDRIKFKKLNGLKIINKGCCTGRIVGGNLSVFNSLIGTKYLPELKNKILLLEDVNEYPYKIDRMFNHLKFSGVFKKVKGIILGKFVSCIEQDKSRKSLTVEEVINDYFNELNIPLLSGFPHSHIPDFLTMPLGIKIILNTSEGCLDFTESAVR